jgi:hypothetical protein
MVLVTTAGEVGTEAALLLSRQDGTSRVTAGIDLSDIRGLDRVPELGGRRNDSGPGAFSLGGELWSLPGVADHDATIPAYEFDSPLRG